MYAIAGVTGHTGSVAADTLLAQGKPVRVLVRDAAKGDAWRARGAEVAVASLEDEDAMTRALTGVEGAYLLLPPNEASVDPVGDSARRVRTLAAAIRASKVPHVVFLSSMGAHLDGATGPIKTLHAAERELAATGTALTVVRPAYFQENWAGSLGALPQGLLPTFVPADLAFPQVSTKDIGRTVAAALVEGATSPSVLELAGPRDLSSNDVAAAVSAITGATVVARDAGLDAVVPTFTSFGLSPVFAELYREMYAGIASGYITWQGGESRSVRGTVDIADTLRALLQR